MSDLLGPFFDERASLVEHEWLQVVHFAVEGGLYLVNLAVKEALQFFIRVDRGHFRFKVACALPA